ncbi:hypothetical protein MKZ38_010235 [Zalerion maritima]|uniref:Uncharacterized protein n=1 Tax=Zalerion maritima TaxID=339359 RepID=A0AAD5WU99_9PEZI|nr:hypothetical protein MKZ38_010235 [Zalerion maritima]
MAVPKSASQQLSSLSTTSSNNTRNIAPDTTHMMDEYIPETNYESIEISILLHHIEDLAFPPANNSSASTALEQAKHVPELVGPPTCEFTEISHPISVLCSHLIALFRILAVRKKHLPQVPVEQVLERVWSAASSMGGSKEKESIFKAIEFIDETKRKTWRWTVEEFSIAFEAAWAKRPTRWTMMEDEGKIIKALKAARIALHKGAEDALRKENLHGGPG